MMIYLIYLLEKNFVKPFDHKVLLSSLDAKEQEYCKWHNSFDHSTQKCNMFRQIIKSAINSGRLKFAHAQESDQLKSIGLYKIGQHGPVHVTMKILVKRRILTP